MHFKTNVALRQVTRVGDVVCMNMDSVAVSGLIKDSMLAEGNKKKIIDLELTRVEPVPLAGAAEPGWVELTNTVLLTLIHSQIIRIAS